MHLSSAAASTFSSSLTFMASSLLPSHCRLLLLLPADVPRVFSHAGVRLKQILTTNHPEKLDPALIRPGRVSKQMYMGHLSLASALQMVRHYFCSTTCGELTAGEVEAFSAVFPVRRSLLFDQLLLLPIPHRERLPGRVGQASAAIMPPTRNFVRLHSVASAWRPGAR